MFKGIQGSTFKAHVETLATLVSAPQDNARFPVHEPGERNRSVAAAKVAAGLITQGVMAG
jgi:hypothetical protein